MTSDTSERGLERLICTALTGAPCDPGVPANMVQQRPATYAAGWICGAAEEYDREYCVDLAQLAAFLRETQPEVCEALDLGQDGPTRRKFLARLQGEVSKRGTIDVLRHGLKHGPHHIDLFYGTPSPGNAKAAERYAQNRFSVTRQLRYSRDETQRALDLGLFINGLPVATFELKNSLTKQTVEDAVQQYQRDRDPREKLFEFGRCVVHFAVDDHEVRFCTHLKGKGSWFLICADKFQTGYDEPLLHTMYVDKQLSGIKAVQTLSRLNRAHPKKHDVFVLDFMNDADAIQQSFADYYRTTILAEETDPNKLHDLKAALDGYQVYAAAQVDEFAALYLDGADRDRLDPILDACVADYRERLDEDGQVDFKGKAKAFLRTYGFLSSILPYTNADWEKLSIFLTFLVPKLPAPVEEDLSKGILEAIDMDSYRVEKQAAARIQLPDADAEIEPVPTTGGGRKPEPELDRLSNILKAFNDQFGNIPWSDADRVHRLITEDIPNRVAADKAYQNARQNSDKQNARIEHDKALARVMTAVLKDDTELFKQFMDNDSFRRWLTDTVFGLTYPRGSGGVAGRP